MIGRRAALAIVAAIACLGLSSCASDSAQRATGPITWTFDRLDNIGGVTTKVEGSPRVVDTPLGKAVQFNGVNDALWIEQHPLAGAATFTVTPTTWAPAAGAGAPGLAAVLWMVPLMPSLLASTGLGSSGFLATITLDLRAIMSRMAAASASARLRRSARSARRLASSASWPADAFTTRSAGLGAGAGSGAATGAAGAAATGAGAGAASALAWLAAASAAAAASASRFASAIARRRSREWLAFDVGDAADLSTLAPASFDVVVLNAVFHWLPDKPRALGQFHQVLKKKGRIGLTTRPPGERTLLQEVRLEVLAEPPFGELPRCLGTSAVDDDLVRFVFHGEQILRRLDRHDDRLPVDHVHGRRDERRDRE